jgi:hypothetical protein
MKAFCVVIGKPLVVARCPLPGGKCTWQHRATNFCKYTDQDLTIEQHAALVGAPTPKNSEVQALEQRLVEAIRNEV